MKRFITTLKEAEIRNVLAVMTVIACFVIQIYVIRKPIPPENHDIVITSITYTLNALLICLGYYFGASKPDKKKPEEKPE